MIVGVMGHARVGKDTMANVLVEELGFVRIGLADPLKRICKEVFDFSYEQLWGDKRDEPDPRYIRRKRGFLGSTSYGSFRDDAGFFQLAGTVFEGKEKLWDEIADEYGNVPNPDTDEYLTTRYALQTLGTEWGRDCYNDLWIDYGIRVARKLLADPTAYYTPEYGVRFYPEVPLKKTTGIVFSDLRFRNEFDAVKKAGGLLVRVRRPGATQILGIVGHLSEEEQNGLDDDEFDAVLDNDKDLDHYRIVIKSFIKEHLRR